MSKAKLMNELINRYKLFLENIDDKEVNVNFLGFLDACRIVLTEEQMLSCINQATTRFQIKKSTFTKTNEGVLR